VYQLILIPALIVVLILILISKHNRRELRKLLDYYAESEMYNKDRTMKYAALTKEQLASVLWNEPIGVEVYNER
jgi:hypothetical protein